MWHWDHMARWGPGWVWMVLLWVLIILAIAALVSWLSGNRAKDKTPLELLKERYARGEIDREKYERIKRDLEQ